MNEVFITQATSDIGSTYLNFRLKSETINAEDFSQSRLEEGQLEIDAEEIFLRDNVSGRSDETCPIKGPPKPTRDVVEQEEGRYTTNYIKMMMVMETMISGRESIFVSA